MKPLFLFFCFLLAGKQPSPKPEPLNSREQKLLEDLNRYRKSRNLSEISLSPRLTVVAQAHAADLRENPPSGRCNMHSWSGKFGGNACCYTPDHKNASCMWEKPKELTGYPGKGYEISAMNTAPPEGVDWLGQWKKSPSHHQVMVNEGIWKRIEWKAVGLAIRSPYAVIWFGEEEDNP